AAWGVDCVDAPAVIEDCFRVGFLARLACWRGAALRLGVVVAIAAACFSAPVQADTIYNWTYQDPNNVNDAGSGTLTVSQDPKTGVYHITAITGTFENVAITGAPIIFGPPGGPPSDNILNPAGPNYLDINGLSFMIGSLDVNIFYNG